MSGAFVAGFVLGALAGGAVAFLCSPGNGKENRDLLMQLLPGGTDDGPDLFERVSAEVKTRLDEGRQAYERASAQTRQRMLRELEASQGGPPATP